MGLSIFVALFIIVTTGATLRAKAFYATIAIAVVVGAALNFSPIDPVKALFWSAVINGVVAVPVMVMMMMLLAGRPKIMGRLTLSRRLKVVGWAATSVMAAAAVRDDGRT